MKQAQFESIREDAWQAFERLLQSRQPLPIDVGQRYRHICQDLSIAKERAYSSALINRLNHIASEGRQLLYRRHYRLLDDLGFFLIYTLPRSIGQHWKAILWAHALFYLCSLIAGTLCYFYPEFVYSIMPPEAVFELEQNFDPNKNLSALRDSSSDFMMFGFYIYNNVGIGLQVYVTGLLFGIGTLITIIYNGLVIGASFGHMAGLEQATSFFSFVAGHAAFELTAICLAAAAGFTMGKALMFPGIYGRTDAIKLAGKETLPLITGVIFLFIAAAFVEAFWSSSTVAPIIKFVVGTTFWIMMLAYFAYSKRISHGS